MGGREAAQDRSGNSEPRFGAVTTINSNNCRRVVVKEDGDDVVVGEGVRWEREGG